MQRAAPEKSNTILILYDYILGDNTNLIISAIVCQQLLMYMLTYLYYVLHQKSRDHFKIGIYIFLFNKA